MKEPDLTKFFSGNFSGKEKKDLKAWLEEEPHHQGIFLEERKLYNISLLHSGMASSVENRGYIRKKIILQCSKVAAIFLFAFVCYYLLDKSINREVNAGTAYQTIRVPFGQRINLELPDGSKMSLNAGAAVKYPVSFNKNIREVVLLDGEAYFEVERNEELPFCVLAGDYTIEVSGTHFNVSVDTFANKFETALFEGAVKVYNSSYPRKAVELAPDMSVCLIEGDLQVKPLARYDRFSWREGVLCFEKEPFEDIMKTFEKSYGCKIIVSNKKVGRYLYTGKFLQTDGVDYALNLLQKSFYFSYSRDKDTNTITIN